MADDSSPAIAAVKKKPAQRRKPSTLSDDPNWYRDAVIYQVHVKSFFDANDDGIGDFRGLIDKLGYIADLGVDTVWLLPFYPSPRRDDGYDIAEFRGVHADYGTMADARDFIAEAHKRGLRVITELVINHTSDQHPWFQKARASKPGSAARDFYVWSDSDQKYSETRIIFCDTEKSNWTWDPVANAYFWHRFYSHQPDLNFDNPAVLKAVLSVMRHWLDLGVDGLRLDAVPYLIEREGTSNENLPETHQILKTIRKVIDAEYPNRMLLAEANMWPEDVQEYFGGVVDRSHAEPGRADSGTPTGKGDECHMAFHFPLMPRMYMAIAQEDRFPIIDIMRQTPDIPEGCQWAIFLRNHDELTLEMVTDMERDYLWATYATERRARLNLGIRRRLAPLLERDRRRIELMNSLLLSMPGTPVIYYGDEIGMGDNIHLGDRDGVRTPMQWTPDRNGGFSKADPERMVLPALQGSLYGFEVVNVESQSRDPHSLLNWTRRMLAVRRRYQAFGRGAIRFLRPANRKILAYIRCYENETLLCVANLSRAAQAVELDLASFAGHTPVELLGGTAFPPIGQLSYLLTLPPYGFYWFSISASEGLQLAGQRPPEALPELVTFVLRAGPTEILNQPLRGTLEGEVLPAYLPMRRWFAAKDRRISKARVFYLAPIPGTEVAFSTVEVRFSDGETARYALPVGIAWESATLPALPQQLALARVRRGRRVGFLTDAFSLEPFARGVLAGLRDSLSIDTDSNAAHGRLMFRPTLRMQQLQIADDAPIQWLSAEQSNSSLTVNDAVVIKLVRRIEPGIHPETEMTRYLTEVGYANTAPLLGDVVRIDETGVENTLVIVQGYLYNEGDAWRWVTDYLHRNVDEFSVSGGDDNAAKLDPAVEGYAAYAANVGQRLAELHAALSQPSDNADFAPTQAGPDDFKHWAFDAAEQLSAALDLLAARKEWPDETTRDLAAGLVARRDAILKSVRGAARLKGHALCTRIHGDFHLGQVLVSRGDSYIIDFEGEPKRPLEERRRKTTPLRDVAGLLRSLDYAIASVAGLEARGDPNRPVDASRDRAQALLVRFAVAGESAFLARYREVAAHSPHPWSSVETETALLDLFLLHKAAYEVGYEAANRPGWLGLPVRGLARLADRLTASSSTGAPKHGQ
ncbi:MAG: maltose alpha-D-glucosyltransferase [Hydrocarboniphaga sp.]|uniref:maltose alpha-D-glucosyltransferase n=1 Tax=Hydrocarboniphaga sp. TaxID=2033016 RepID=UPI00262A5587|nr:maltose alpha-D-glucosyltransferase [Hydrocarboniphaga sp.]MDB5970522.1 maltose alpha-D-glucosyltransferase [Hydrocarboniphaga sp.]